MKMQWLPTYITQNAPPEHAGRRSDRVIVGMMKGKPVAWIVRLDGKYHCTQALDADYFAAYHTAAEAKAECESRANIGLER